MLNSQAQDLCMSLNVTCMHLEERNRATVRQVSCWRLSRGTSVVRCQSVLTMGTVAAEAAAI